jgi:uncharacterized protein
MLIKLKNQHPGVQFAVFFALTVGMILVNLAINEVFFKGVSGALTKETPTAQQINSFKWFQVVTTTMIFIMPALLYGRLSHERPLRYIGIQPNPGVKMFLVTLVLLVAIQPFAMTLGEINRQANLGESLRRLEDLSEKALARFLVMDSPNDLFVNFIVVAVLPALGEELFFRGSLQNILERWTQRPAVAIILSSVFFAFFHLSFFKFLPILVLGIALGTLFYMTRNLWYSIFFHFVNNSMALLASYYAQRNEFMKQLANDEVKLSWLVALASLLVTLALFFFIRKQHPHQPLEKTWLGNVYDNYLNTPR